MSMNTNDEERKSVTLRSSDGMEFFVLDEKIMIRESEMMKDMIDDGVIDIDNVTGRILGLIVDYFNRPPDGGDIAARILQLDDHSLLDLMKASRNLRVKTLHQWVFKKVGRPILEKSPEEVQKWLDFTPEGQEVLVRVLKKINLD